MSARPSPHMLKRGPPSASIRVTPPYPQGEPRTLLSRSSLRLLIAAFTLVLVFNALRPAQEAIQKGTPAVPPATDNKPTLESARIDGALLAESLSKDAPPTGQRSYPPPVGRPQENSSEDSLHKSSAASSPSAAQPARPVPVPDANTLAAIAQTLPDVRFDKYAVAIKTSSGTAQRRAPVLFATWVRAMRNVLLVGDASESDVGATGLNMIDVVTGVFEAARNRTKVADKETAPEEQDENKSKEGEEEEEEDDPSDPLAKYLRDAERAAKAAAENAAQGQESEYYKRRKRSIPRILRRAAIPPAKENVASALEAAEAKDADKYISGVRALYKKHPTADWYILVDDDAYMFPENLHRLLSPLDPSKPHYLGSPTWFSESGCQGSSSATESDAPSDGPSYAPASAGIILSRAAIAQLLPLADSCIVQYSVCDAGAARLAQCLHDAGITLTMDAAVTETFHAESAARTSAIEFPDNACARPVSFHGMAPEDMRRVHAIAISVRDAVRREVGSKRPGAKPLTRMSHPWLFPAEPAASPAKAAPAVAGAAPAVAAAVSRSSTGEQAQLPVALDSPHYAPVHMGDLFSAFVSNDRAIPAIVRDAARPSGHAYVADQGGVLSPEECRGRCINDPECRSWEFDLAGLVCRRMKGVPRPVAKGMVFSGMMKGRYHCEEREL